jgi:hypothetical protein
MLLCFYFGIIELPDPDGCGVAMQPTPTEQPAKERFNLDCHCHGKTVTCLLLCACCPCIQHELKWTLVECTRSLAPSSRAYQSTMWQQDIS